MCCQRCRREGRAEMARTLLRALDDADTFPLTESHLRCWSVVRGKSPRHTCERNPHASQHWRLTPMERQIAGLIFLGKWRAPEIAAILGKNVRTVKNQIHALFEKAGVRGAIHLVGKLAMENLEWP
jgi:DNA-binding CsgD family transcriptional regulator